MNPTTGLPEGCPERMHFNSRYGIHRPGKCYKLNLTDCVCDDGDCIPVEILPQGTRERLAAQAEYIALLEKSIMESVNFLYVHGVTASRGDIEQGKELRAKIQSLTPRAPDANNH